MLAQSTFDFKLPLKKLVAFFEKSRDNWMAKYFAKRDQAILLANQVRAVEKSRESWRTIAREAQRELDELKQAQKKGGKPPGSPTHDEPTSSGSATKP